MVGEEADEEKMTEPDASSPVWTEETPHTVSPDRPAAPPLAIRYLDFGLSATAAGFLWATAILFALSAALQVAHWMIWSQWIDEGANFFDNQRVEDIEGAATAAVGVAILATVVSGVLFLVWFNQAYKAGKSRGATGRKWGSGWTIGGWFIPIGNLVIPKLVMNETDRMLNPSIGLPPTHDRWRSCPRLLVSDVWWLLMISGVLLGWASAAVMPDFVEDSSYGTYLGVSALQSGVTAAAAVLAGVMVLIIGRRGRQPLNQISEAPSTGQRT